MAPLSMPANASEMTALFATPLPAADPHKVGVAHAAAPVAGSIGSLISEDQWFQILQTLAGYISPIFAPTVVRILKAIFDAIKPSPAP